MPQIPVKKETTLPASTPTPWQPFEALRREMERVLDDFDGDRWLSAFRNASLDLRNPWLRNGFEFAPPAEVAEKDRDYEITVELPGMEEKDIDVKVADGVLTIKGEKTEEKKEDKKGYHLSERSYGSFFRSFMLPDGCDPDKIAAKFDKGVLKISFPKPAKAEEKKIAVKSA